MMEFEPETTFFCSDPHSFHTNILKYSKRYSCMTDSDRELFEAHFFTHDMQGSPGDPHFDRKIVSDFKFTPESNAKMNRVMIDNINRRVQKSDTLWCLGDWSFGGKKSYYANSKWFRDQLDCQNIYLVRGNHDRDEIFDLFKGTYEQIIIRVGSQKLILNHFPLITWAGASLHLHGHVHNLFANTDFHPLRKPQAYRGIDVGFDAHDMQVWSMKEINAEMKKRGIVL